MAAGEPSSKKLKSEEDETRYFKDFLADKNNESLISDLRTLVAEFNFGASGLSMAFLRVKGSNATLAESFSRARLDVETYQNELGRTELAPIGLFFLKGLNLVKSFLDKTSPVVPEDVVKRRALQDLLQFLTTNGRGSSVLAENRGKKDYEKEWSVRFANHLLIPLVPQKTFIIDSMYGEHLDLNMCCSTKHPVEGAVGDTSFGCLNGWHGHVDILITDKEVPLSVMERNEDFEVASVHSDNTIEVKRDEDFKPQALSQVMAETIVFSFLQHKLNGDKSGSSFVPGIGISPEKLIVYLYDCVEDVLLEAMPIGVYEQKERGLLNIRAVLVLWMVLNYELFCNEIPDDLQKYKAQFFEMLGPKHLEMYRKDVEKGCRVNPGDSVWHKPNWIDSLCKSTCDNYYHKYVPVEKTLSLKEV